MLLLARVFSRRGASAIAAGTLLLTGCSTVSEYHGAVARAEAAPRPTAVAPDTQLSSAERIAALHEGDFVLTGAGDSMLPLYRAGTAVVVHPTSYFMLRPGMPVVYFNRHGTPVAHLLVEKLPRGWLAMGVNNREPDDDLVTPNNLVGIIRCAFVATEGHGRGGAAGLLAYAPVSRSSMTLLH